MLQMIRSHRRVWLLLAALSSLLVATVLASRLLTAQPARTGDEIAVDPLAAAVTQEEPATAALPNGHVLVVWNEWRRATIRRSFPSLLRGRLYDRTGVPRGPAFTLQADQEESSTRAALAPAGPNGFVLVWHGWVPRPSGGLQGSILARRLDASGRPTGPPVPVSGPLQELVSGPFVGTAADGSFVVAWTSTDVFVRRFDAAGQPRGGPEKLPGQAAGTSRFGQSLAVRGDGTAVVLWREHDALTPEPALRLRRFDRDGAPLGAPVPVVPPHAVGAVAFGPDGGFLLVWGAHDGLWARAFDREGMPQAEQRIGEQAASQRIGLVADPAGTFLALWSQQTDGHRAESWGLQISPDGDPLGPPRPLQHHAGPSAGLPVPLATGDGSFAVFWGEGDRRDEGLVAGIHGQWLATTGSPGTLELDNARYAVSEGADEPLTLYVVRRDGTAGAVSVDVSLTGAAQGSQTVTFEDGDSTPRALAIPVADDDLPGNDRTVRVLLSDPAGGAALGSRRQADVDVRDDDAPFPLLSRAGRVQVAGSTDKYESATEPAVAADASGKSVALWGIDVNPYYAMRSGIAGQRLGPDGRRSRRYWFGARYKGTVGRPRMAMQPGGGFVVVWDSAGEDGPVEHLARGFDAQGAPAGPIYSFGVLVRGIAPLPGGRYVAAGGGSDDRGSGLFAWSFQGDGGQIGRPVRVSDAVTEVPPPAAVAADASGRFVVVWSVFPTGRNPSGLFARRFSPAGEPLGPAFRVSVGGAGYDIAPAVAADAAGDFVAVWTRDWDGDGSGIFARAFDAAGRPLSAEIPVASLSAGSQSHPDVAMAADGRYLITWMSLETSNVSAQLRQLPATRLGGDLILRGETRWPAAAWSASGQFVTTWLDSSGQFDVVRVRRFPL